MLLWYGLNGPHFVFVWFQVAALDDADEEDGDWALDDDFVIQANEAEMFEDGEPADRAGPDAFAMGAAAESTDDLRGFTAALARWGRTECSLLWCSFPHP